MKPRRARAVFAAAALVALSAASAAAHHGWSGYDAGQVLNLAGTIRDSGYEHPHGFLRLEVPGKVWWVVLSPPSRMERRGLGASVRWGALRFAGVGTEVGSHPAFRLNVGVIAAAVLDAAVFHRVPFRSVGDWDTDVTAPAAAKAAGGLSLLLWTGVIACGRLLAYL